MKNVSRERPGAISALAKGGRRGIPVAVLGALAATALSAYAAHTSARSTARFSLSVAPAQRAVAAGSPARYRIAISRRGFRGAIRLTVTGSPRYLRPHLAAGRAAHRTLVLASTARSQGHRYALALTVTTSRRTPVGRYLLVVRARGGGHSRSVRLALRIPRPAAVGVSGAVSGLEPGLSQPLDLALSNRTARYLWVTQLTVTAESVSAPRSSALLPCSLADFSMRQLSGFIPLVLPPFSARTLSGLRVPPAARPQVMLLDRPFDQDGCQGATVSLAYSARGVTV